MWEITPLTPSYSRALLKYQKAVKERVLAERLIKDREMKRVAQEQEKLRIKLGSARHVQKNGVLYKGKGAKQVVDRNREEEEYRESVHNNLMVVARKIKAADAA
jgi:hypothetical protein